MFVDKSLTLIWFYLIAYYCPEQYVFLRQQYSKIFTQSYLPSEMLGIVFTFS